MRHLLNIHNLLWLALALALAGSLTHLAAMFASVDGNVPLGWLQAIAIDAGLFALAYSIKRRRADRRPTRRLWWGVGLFVLISIYGNLAYAIVASGDTLPNWLAQPKPYILAGSLPVLVLFLAELLSDDRQYVQAQAVKQAKRQVKQQSDTDNGGNLDKARQVKDNKIRQRRQAVATMLDNGEPENDIARQLGVSLRTIQRDINSLNGSVR